MTENVMDWVSKNWQLGSKGMVEAKPGNFTADDLLTGLRELMNTEFMADIDFDQAVELGFIEAGLVNAVR